LSTYRDAGVDVTAGERAVSMFAETLNRSFSSRVLSSVGGFGSLYSIDNLGVKEPILVSSTDGVGTKTQLARLLGRYDTIGQDLVAMCVDDIACYGAQPLFFLDYLSVGKQSPEIVSEIVTGVATACTKARCSLIGGETAEHPGVMDPDDFDLGGFVVGLVAKDQMWGPNLVREGDLLLGLKSPNLRSNGFSLIRRIYEIDRLLQHPQSLSDHTREELKVVLEPSILYSPYLQDMPMRQEVRVAAHITGGGLLHNLSRSIPDGLVAEVVRDSWPVPEIFLEVKRRGDVPSEEMYRIFNMGVGMVLVVSPDSISSISSYFYSVGMETYTLGQISKRTKDEEGAVWVE
jgi:phosphoribosylformylglycinamidine cyclo-ligase